jgi:Phosphoesterase family.
LARFLTILALMLATLASSLSLSPSPASAAKRKPKQPPPRTAVIVLENHEYPQVIGNSGEMPFLNGLVPRGTLVTEYSGVSHPSLPNYLALIGGSTYGINSDCTECWASGTNLGVQLSEARISWRAYMEDMPEPCYPGATYGSYAKKHDPFMYFESVTTVPSRCQNVVPAGSWLEADLRSKKGLRTFTWITPNLCNDGHDCSLATTDSWLSAWVPPVIKKLGPEGILIITFDEGSPGLHVPALVVGPGARKGTQLSGQFNHYSLLATIEARYHLPRINEATPALPMKGAILKPRKKHVKH